jgi:hypothetical protein
MTPQLHEDWRACISLSLSLYIHAYIQLLDTGISACRCRARRQEKTEGASGRRKAPADSSPRDRDPRLQRDRLSRRRYCRLQIVDFGSACWRDRHFTDDIQTRQCRLRSSSAGLRCDTDLWSLYHMIFELATEGPAGLTRAETGTNRTRVTRTTSRCGRADRRDAAEHDAAGQHTSKYFLREGCCASRFIRLRPLTPRACGSTTCLQLRALYLPSIARKAYLLRVVISGGRGWVSWLVWGSVGV